MNVFIKKYFINPKLNDVTPGIVIGCYNSDPSRDFIDPFVSLNDLIVDLQNRMNETANEMVIAPDEIAKTNAAVKWSLLNDLLQRFNTI